MDTNMNVLDTALMWRELGIATIPILHRSKSPAIDKWKPYQSRLPTEFELRAWFGRPGYSIAVITGWQGLVIVDFDDMKKHDDWFYDFSKLWASFMCQTYNVRTPRGWHYYFYCAEPAQCVKLDAVDVRAGGSYCLTPPSIHPSGTPYIGVESPASIQRLNSIADILPGYQQAISQPPARAPASSMHPLDVAMLPHTSTTIEAANAKLDYEQLLGRWRGIHYTTHYLCPLHEDTQPSLKVYSDGHWYCFGCNIGGRDKLDLYAKLNNMTIREALCTL